MLATGEVWLPKEFWYIVGRGAVRCDLGGEWFAERDCGGGVMRAWAPVLRGSGRARWQMQARWFAALLAAIRDNGGGGRLVVERGHVCFEGRCYPIDSPGDWRPERVPQSIEWGVVETIPKGRWSVKGGRVVPDASGFPIPIPLGVRWVGVWGNRLVFRWPHAEIVQEVR